MNNENNNDVFKRIWNSLPTKETVFLIGVVVACLGALCVAGYHDSKTIVRLEHEQRQRFVNDIIQIVKDNKDKIF